MTHRPNNFSRLPYDSCAYDKELQESTGPFSYQMYDGKYENCNPCARKPFTRPFDKTLVDVESDLSNRVRMNSRCPVKKYSASCVKSPSCVSTFDPSNPVVTPPMVCSAFDNSQLWTGGNGIVLPETTSCSGKY